MLPPDVQQNAQNCLTNYFGKTVHIHSATYVGGGSINQAACLFTNVGKVFIKWNDAHAYPAMFETEVKGLNLLGSAGCIAVPQVYAQHTGQRHSFLLMEFVETALPNAQFWQTFGRQLAAMHRVTQSFYGLDHQNYMGSLPQHNQTKTHFATFFHTQRLLPQVTMAVNKRLLQTQHVALFEKLYHRLPSLLPTEPPALVHGDLWSGNFLTSALETPVLIDPAAHFGHREADLAMTYLFGGFNPLFYQSYQQHYPLQPHFNQRIAIYNLYPLLVHVNLFGTSYLPPIEATLKKMVL